MLKTGADGRPLRAGRTHAEAVDQPGAPSRSPWFHRPGGDWIRWDFPNPFDHFREIAADTPLWPIGPGRAAVPAGNVEPTAEDAEPTTYLNPPDAPIRWDSAITEVSTDARVTR